MSKHSGYAILSAIVFLLIAFVHVLRLILQWDMTINGWYIPAWVSLVTVLVAGFLSFRGFRLFEPPFIEPMNEQRTGDQT
jgi:hypothetical protein